MNATPNQIKYAKDLIANHTKRPTYDDVPGKIKHPYFVLGTQLGGIIEKEQRIKLETAEVIARTLYIKAQEWLSTVNVESLDKTQISILIGLLKFSFPIHAYFVFNGISEEIVADEINAIAGRRVVFAESVIEPDNTERKRICALREDK